MDISKLKITIVAYEQFSEYEFAPPATFFVRGATGDYYFIHTAKRAIAQAWADDYFTKGRYTVVAARMQKEKPKSESGTYSASGVGSRKK